MNIVHIYNQLLSDVVFVDPATVIVYTGIIASDFRGEIMSPRAPGLSWEATKRDHAYHETI